MEKTETPTVEKTEIPILNINKEENNVVPEKRKRSEVLAEHEELQKKNEELLKEMQQREYEVDFKSKAVFNKFVKFLEKDAKWGHTTAAGLIMLFNNFREEKEKTKDPEWNNLVTLRAINVSTLWQMLTTMEGSGFFEARNFVELMAAIGQPISEAVRQVHTDNQELRNNHEALVKLDSLLDHGQLIEDCMNKKDEVSEEK